MIVLQLIEVLKELDPSATVRLKYEDDFYGTCYEDIEAMHLFSSNPLIEACLMVYILGTAFMLMFVVPEVIKRSDVPWLDRLWAVHCCFGWPVVLVLVISYVIKGINE